MIYKNSTTKTLLIVAVATLLFVAAPLTFGQKGDIPAGRAPSRDGTMDVGFLVRPDMSDEIDGTDDEYFYKFQAGPGKLTVMLEITASETNAGAMLDLFGNDDKALLSNMLVQAANRGTERATQTVNLVKSHVIILRIKGMRYGSSAGYPGTYKILLGGTAVNFKLGKPDSQADGANERPWTPPTGTGGKINNQKPETAPTEGAEEASIPPATGGKNQSNTPEVPQADSAGQGSKPAVTPTDSSGQTKKPDAVDKVIEKGKAKSNKLLEFLNKIKAKIPDSPK